MNNSFFKYFYYVSLICLAAALWKADYLTLPRFHSPAYLVPAVSFLFMGFLVEAYPWKRLLAAEKYPVSTRHSLASIGISVFGKYIPGKVWIIIGRAGYINALYRYPSSRISAISLNLQLLTLWSGMALGTAGLVVFGLYGEFAWVLGPAWLILGAIIFTDSIHHAATYLQSRLGMNGIRIPRLSFQSILRTLPSLLMQWLLWCTGFQFLILAMTQDSPHAFLGIAFAVAATLGILSIVAPGGLGVREGVLVFFLTSAGLSLQEATTISIAARLWFLAGELFIFLVASALDKKTDRT